MPPLTKLVDKLTITFLVDNNIEWFTQLPPGFTHEVKQHLTEHDPPLDPVTGAPLLDFENYCCGAHGFSALIETQVDGNGESHLTLFDTGPESRSIARNVASMEVPLERVERIILSHWHSDHSGGILSFLGLRRDCIKDISESTTIPTEEFTYAPCVVDLHPDRPIARGIAPNGKLIGQLNPDPTFEEIKALGGVVETHKEGHAVADGAIWVSGEIPRVTEYEQGLLGAVRFVNKEWVPEEHIMDERYAAIDVAGKGLVIFSACSHAGIVNVVKDAVNKFKRPVHMVIGGLHLATPDLTDRIAPTVDFLANKLRPAPTYILPMHCSGFKAKVALEHALGEGCVPAGTGIRVEVSGDWKAEKILFPPTIGV
ncbi:beta-lactamase-like protein [Abortiporus biennis]|nr:beta-lactamase-like protein [Abortiporus biennis]